MTGHDLLTGKCNNKSFEIQTEIFFVGSPRALKWKEFPDFDKICNWVQSGKLVNQICDQEPVEIE